MNEAFNSHPNQSGSKTDDKEIFSNDYISSSGSDVNSPKEQKNEASKVVNPPAPAGIQSLEKFAEELK